MINSVPYKKMSQIDYDELYLLQKECAKKGIHNIVNLMALDAIGQHENELEAYKSCIKKVEAMKKQG